MSDELKHYGVLGMKWGRRKSSSSSGTKKKEPSKLRTKVENKVKAEVGSLKREMAWRNTTRKIGNMSTKDINKLAQRIQMENEMKRLTKVRNDPKSLVKRMVGDKTISTEKDRQDYLKRGKMSDEELARKVNRLRAKDNLRRAVSQASKEQIDLGKTIVKKYQGSSLRDSVESAAQQYARDSALRRAGFERIPG